MVDILEAINNNLNKFDFTRQCSFLYWYSFENIELEFNSGNIIPEYSLYYNGCLVRLSFFERRKLKKTIKKLNKLKEERLRLAISEELEN